MRKLTPYQSPGREITRQAMVFLVVVAAFAAPARAEDTRHKWQFGFGLSYFSTEDDIRSDADLAGCIGTPPDLTCTDVDVRPDANLLNENSIRDDIQFDFSASYGFTRFFAMELSAGYFEGEVSKLETYRSFQKFNPTINQVLENTFVDNNFFPAADITQIPLRLSALIRFRPESPFAPYVGAGLGYVFTDLNNSAQFDALNTTLNTFQATDVGAPFGPDGILSLDPDPGLPDSLQEVPAEIGLGVITDPVQISVDSGMTMHIRGGVDYYFTKNFSLYVDGTYTWTDPSVEIRVAGSKSGQVSVLEFFDDGPDGFVGPWVVDSSGRRAATSADTCRDAMFSGLQRGTVADCLGDDLNGNFIQDPGEIDLDGDGFNRTFGVCIGFCDGTDGMGNPAVPIYQARVPGQAIIGTLARECIAGDSTIDTDCPGAGGTGNAPVYEWVHRVNNQLFQISPADDLIGVNNFIIQGGDIDLEGFAIGVGVKFTF